MRYQTHLLPDDWYGILLHGGRDLVAGLLDVPQQDWVQGGNREAGDWLRLVVSSHLDWDLGVLAEVDSRFNPDLEQIFGIVHGLGNVNLLGVALGILVGSEEEEGSW